MAPKTWFCLIATVVLWAAHPIVTRSGVKEGFAVADLVALRFGISALLFAPMFLRAVPGLELPTIVRGIGFAISQGAPLSILIFTGLTLAPASHATSLVLGLVPLWVGLTSVLLYREKLPAMVAIGLAGIAAGAVVFTYAGAVPGLDVLRGDLMFVAASMLASAYFVLLRGSSVAPELAAAFIAIFSAALFLPWYFLQHRQATINPALLAWLFQAFYQGVLIGFVSFIAVNHAIAGLGRTTVTAVLSVVPPLTALLGIPLLDEVPTAAELGGIALITCGVLLAIREPLTPKAAAGSL